MKTNGLAETMDQDTGAVLRTLLPADEVDQGSPRLEIFTFSDKVKPLNLRVHGATRVPVEAALSEEISADPFDMPHQAEVHETPAPKGPSFFARMIAKLKFSGRKNRRQPAGLGLS